MGIDYIVAGEPIVNLEDKCIRTGCLKANTTGWSPILTSNSECEPLTQLVLNAQPILATVTTWQIARYASRLNNSP